MKVIMMFVRYIKIMMLAIISSTLIGSHVFGMEPEGKDEKVEVKAPRARLRLGCQEIITNRIGQIPGLLINFRNNIGNNAHDIAQGARRRVHLGLNLLRHVNHRLQLRQLVRTIIGLYLSYDQVHTLFSKSLQLVSEYLYRQTHSAATSSSDHIPQSFLWEAMVFQRFGDFEHMSINEDSIQFVQLAQFVEQMKTLLKDTTPNYFDLDTIKRLLGL